MNHSSIGQALRGLAVFFAFLGCAHAGSFTVNPVRVTLSAKQPVAAITVRNAGNEPTVVQIEASAWSQEQGVDVLNSTNEILATPPIFTLPAGSTQIVRVGLRRAPDMQAELSYRLILREVPPANAPANSLRVALRISMPVFAVPAAATAPDIRWRATRTHDGAIRVHATNNGNAHIQVGKLELASGDQTLATRTAAEYVLPANTRTWIVNAKPVPAIGAMVRIVSQTDAGKVQSDVALEKEDAQQSVAVSPAAPR